MANAPLTVEVFEAVALASASAQTVVLSDGSHPPISYLAVQVSIDSIDGAARIDGQQSNWR